MAELERPRNSRGLRRAAWKCRSNSESETFRSSSSSSECFDFRSRRTFCPSKSTRTPTTTPISTRTFRPRRRYSDHRKRNRNHNRHHPRRPPPWQWCQIILRRTIDLLSKHGTLAEITTTTTQTTIVFDSLMGMWPVTIAIHLDQIIKGKLIKIKEIICLTN